ALGQTDGGPWRTACKQLWAAKAKPGTEEEYVAYALTLVDLKTEGKGAPDAAKRLLGLLGKRDDLPAVLASVPFRKAKASRFLQEAFLSLQGGGTFRQPFKDADSAGQAYDILRAARKLAGEGADVN